jgi:hypothetical protein
MIRLHITTEGQTEREFAEAVLMPHLSKYNVFVYACNVLIGKETWASKQTRGGLVNYKKAKRDILDWIKQDNHPECRFTTMFDLYGLPKGFPGYAEACKKTDPYERVKILEESMKQDINDSRFIPYIQIYEFEALILAAPESLGIEYHRYATGISNLVSMVGNKNPELINDGVQTAPSKRIRQQIPGYNKVTAGVLVVKETGLPTLRAKCRHFNEWLLCLEQLAGVTP